LKKVTGVKAAVLNELPATTLTISDVPVPPLANADHILLRVHACGICGTDVHIMAGGSYAPQLPFVLGHEPVGIVEDASATPGRAWIGRRVAITLFTPGDKVCWGCDTDDGPCSRGDERLCGNMSEITGTYNAWGAFADYVRVHEHQLVEAPGELSDAEVASLVDAGATAFNATRQALAHAASAVVVLGAGPVGLLVAEALRLHDIEPTLVDTSSKRADAARALGYDVSSDLATVVGHFDCAIDCTGAQEAVAWAAKALAPRGLIVVVGYTTVAAFDFAPIARKELRILGVRSGSRQDLVDALTAAAERRIHLPAIESWPLVDINAAFHALRAGEVAGKAVIRIRD
jgi:D-arabinose 1-dehydrogenase-like Zn-dependent alcohol dehydrogenase